MRTRQIAGLVVLLFIGCTTAQPDPFAGETTAPQTAEAAEQEAAPTEPPIIPAINLTGSGKAATQQFTIEGGVTIFEIAHQGSSNFIAQLLSGTSGELVELLANAIGNYSGSTVAGVPAGEYAIDIDADGPWTIAIKQPRLTQGSATSPASGSGPSAIGPVAFDGGLETFQLQHTGESNFIVQLLDSEGALEEILANEIGTFSGSKATGIDAGLYWLDVDAEGSWSIQW